MRLPQNSNKHVPNAIKDGHDGLAVQVTGSIRDHTGIVEENGEGDPIRPPEMFVYLVDQLLLVIDTDRIRVDDREELVASAIDATESVCRGEQISVKIAGNGYQVQLPGCRAAGFTVGQRAPTKSAPDVSSFISTPPDAWLRISPRCGVSSETETLWVLIRHRIHRGTPSTAIWVNLPRGQAPRLPASPTLSDVSDSSPDTVW